MEKGVEYCKSLCSGRTAGKLGFLLSRAVVTEAAGACAESPPEKAGQQSSTDGEGLLGTQP